MLSLVYVSNAVEEFSGPELTQLLEISRANNTPLGLTGMLLYKSGSFIQVLEGPDDTVLSKFSKITKDPRHNGILRLLKTPVEDRRFPDWSMGFRNLNDPAVRETPGYSEFMNEPFTSEPFRTDPSRSMRLLGVFRRNMTR